MKTDLNWIYKSLLIVTFSATAFFLKATFEKMTSLEVEMTKLRVDIASMKVLTAEDVKDIVVLEIYKYHKGLNGEELK